MSLTIVINFDRFVFLHIQIRASRELFAINASTSSYSSAMQAYNAGSDRSRASSAAYIAPMRAISSETS
jgi:hypothetical protein